MQKKDDLSKIIDILIEEDIDISDERCPFCGASTDFIETYEVEMNDNEEETETDDEIYYADGSGQEDEFENDEEEGLETIEIDPIEFHCMKCSSSWVIDQDGNEYLIEPSDDIEDTDEFTTYDDSMDNGDISYMLKFGKSNINESNDLFSRFEKFAGTKIKVGRNVIKGYPVDIDDGSPEEGISMTAVDSEAAKGLSKELRKSGFKVSKFSNLGILIETVKGKRVRKRPRRKSTAAQRIRNIKLKRIKKRKAAQASRLRDRVGGSRTKKVVWRDGKYIVVKKDFRGRVKKKPSNENLYFDAIKKLDILFEFNGRLLRFANKVKNPSNFETLVSKFNKTNENPIFENFITFLNEHNYIEESNYLKIVNETILNEAVRVNTNQLKKQKN